MRRLICGVMHSSSINLYGIKMLYKFITYTVLIFFFICTAEAQNINDSPLKIPEFINTPFPSLVEFAKKHDIALNHIEIGGNDIRPEKGNRVTFLLTLYHGSSMQQWLLIITQDILNHHETQLEPLPDDTIYASTGRVFSFKNTRTALILNLIGPFTGKKSKSEKKYIKQMNNPYRILVSKENLNCNLDRYAKTAMVLTKRCEAAGVKLSDLFFIGSSNPISESNLEKGKPFTEIVYPTVDEERILFNVGFALNSFYSAAMEIDDLRKILYKVIDNSSIIWSAISNFGIRRTLNNDPSKVNSFDANGFGLEIQAYEQPLKLFINHKLELKASIIMTEPLPPLQVCAGIVEIYAEHPVDKDNRLLIQLISANIKS